MFVNRNTVVEYNVRNKALILITPFQRPLTHERPVMLTLTEAHKPQKLNTWITVYLESEAEVENTVFLRLDPKLGKNYPSKLV